MKLNDSYWEGEGLSYAQKSFGSTLGRLSRAELIFQLGDRLDQNAVLNLPAFLRGVRRAWVDAVEGVRSSAIERDRLMHLAEEIFTSEEKS